MDVDVGGKDCLFVCFYLCFVSTVEDTELQQIRTYKRERIGALDVCLFVLFVVHCGAPFLAQTVK